MNVLIIIRELLTITSLIAGVIVAIPFIKKKILEERLKTTIDEIDTQNKINTPVVYKLLENYSFKDTINRPISIKELSRIHIDILELKKKLFLGQGEVATLTINLEEFLRRVIHWYKNYRCLLLSTSEIYNIVNNVLCDIYYLMIKNVPYPKNSFLSKDSYINKVMLAYCSNTSINIYDNFEIGRIHDVASAIYPLFYNHINNLGNFIFYKSLVDIYGMNIKYFIIRLLYIKKYYIPVLLKYVDSYRFLPDQYLVLSGFRVCRNISHGRLTIKVFYANPISHMKLSYLSKMENLKNFKDIYLGLEDTISHKEIISHNYNNVLEMLEIEFNENYLVANYWKRKYEIENKMKSEKRGRF
jgi:hypothetical protein